MIDEEKAFNKGNFYLDLSVTNALMFNLFMYVLMFVV